MSRRHVLVYLHQPVPVRAAILEGPQGPDHEVTIAFSSNTRELCRWTTGRDAYEYLVRAGYFAADRYLGLIATDTGRGVDGKLVVIVPATEIDDPAEDEWTDVVDDDATESPLVEAELQDLEMLNDAELAQEIRDELVARGFDPDADDDVDDTDDTDAPADADEHAPWAASVPAFEAEASATDTASDGEPHDPEQVPSDMVVIGTLFRPAEDCEAGTLEAEAVDMLHGLVFGTETPASADALAVDAFLASLSTPSHPAA